MKQTTWKISGIYLLALSLLLVCSTASAQITIKTFNAKWNEANNVSWVHDLTDVKTISYIDVGKNSDAQKEYKIAVVPTIIIFKDGDEVARFQADLSFKMVATREEVQEEIDNQLMSDF